MRFVILKHWHPHNVHWDFLLEPTVGLAWTWALPSLPRHQTNLGCQRLADHRPLYFVYQGPVTPSRGRVQRIDAGVYSPLLLQKDFIHLRISGKHYQGIVKLTQTSEENGSWTFFFSSRLGHTPRTRSLISLEHLEYARDLPRSRFD